MTRFFTLPSDVPSPGKEAFTIAFLGDSGVGKSTVACRLLQCWTDLSIKQRTEGGQVDTFDVVGRDLNVWLLNATFKTRRDLSLPKCDVFVLVYSIVDDDSFKTVCDVREYILQTTKVPVVFLANKTDIAGSVDVMQRCSRMFNVTRSWNHRHVEVSAETDRSLLCVLGEILLSSDTRSKQAAEGVREATVEPETRAAPTFRAHNKGKLCKVKKLCPFLFRKRVL